MILRQNISIEESRKKLGEQGKSLTDEQVQKILSLLYVLCDRTIKNVINKTQTSGVI